MTISSYHCQEVFNRQMIWVHLNISPEIGIQRNAVSLLRSCESLWMGVETVAFGETPLKPVLDVVRYSDLSTIPS